MEMAQLSFRTTAEDWREGSILLRRVIGMIPPLHYSLVGSQPTCLKGTNLKEHVNIRKVQDADGMKAYINYLFRVIASTPAPHPQLARLPGGGFRYRIASGNAETNITELYGDRKIVIYGWANLQSTDAIVRNLQKERFHVEVDGVEA